MKFTLTTTKLTYTPEEADELRPLGFSFLSYNPMLWEDHEEVLAIVQTKNPSIELNTLEELMEFRRKYGMLILSEGQIELYNGYRE
jgi:hypothetical protein